MWNPSTKPLLRITPPRGFFPDDCECDYNTQITNCLDQFESQIHHTGSGHRKTCSAHRRWETNGNTWRPSDDVNLTQYTEEAMSIIDELPDDGRLSTIPREFVRGVVRKLNEYDDQAFISKHEISWLRQLKEQFQ